MVEGKGGPVHGPLTARNNFIFDTAMRYAEEGVGAAIIAGREFAPLGRPARALLGVRMVLAESYVVHRSTWSGWVSSRSSSSRAAMLRWA